MVTRKQGHGQLRPQCGRQDLGVALQTAAPLGDTGHVSESSGDILPLWCQASVKGWGPVSTGTVNPAGHCQSLGSPCPSKGKGNGHVVRRLGGPCHKAWP